MAGPVLAARGAFFEIFLLVEKLPPGQRGYTQPARGVVHSVFLYGQCRESYLDVSPSLSTLRSLASLVRIFS
jgi:hypothetical protein